MIRWHELFRKLPEPWLVMVCGLVGVGKTTIAREIARSLRARYLNTDKIGYRLFGEQRTYGSKYYARVYSVMLARAERALAKKRHVVLDGTFLRSETRRRFLAGLQERASPWVVYVTCPEEIVRARLEARRAVPLHKRGYSDGRYEIYQAMKEKLSDNWSDPRTEGVSFVTVDTAPALPCIVEITVQPAETIACLKTPSTSVGKSSPRR